MVKIINKSVCRGVAGKRKGSVKGIVIHNTWDNASAESHVNRLARYTTDQLKNGFAHYFIDHKAIVRVEDTFNGAWHVANSDGNMNYIGYEVKGNRNTPRAEFLAGEQNAFKQAAEDLLFYKLPANRNTVRLHSEFCDTECPKRSLIEHLGWDSTKALPAAKRDQMKDYFIAEINKYMKGGTEVAKVKYHDKPGKFKVLKDLGVYNDKLRKNKSQILYKKGSVLIIDKIHPIKGSVPVGEPRAGGFVTVRTDYLKRM